MNINEVLHGISTILVSKKGDNFGQGTGFFYHRYGPATEDVSGSDGQGLWRPIENLWIVTNRHVVLHKSADKEELPESFSFHLRKIEGQRLVWEEVRLDAQQLQQRALFHQLSQVDVCTIEVHDLITSRFSQNQNYMRFHSVCEQQLPGKSLIHVEASDDALVVGYPRGFYDRVNLFPIIKSGIVASHFGRNFEGLPCFLIDAKLFPGSSGSIVVSRPVNFMVTDSGPRYSQEKQFAFLGIFSGEPFTEQIPIEFEDMTILRRSSFNLGIVWYGQLVEDILGGGVRFNEHEPSAADISSPAARSDDSNVTEEEPSVS